MRRLILALLVLTLAVGCRPTPATPPTPTEPPALPSATAEVLAPTATVEAARPTEAVPPSATPEVAEPAATSAPEATAPPVPSATPVVAAPTVTTAGGAVLTRPAPIWIQQPGAGSLVVSPVRVAGMADGTFEQNLIVRLVSMDGVELRLLPTTIAGEMGQRGAFSIDVPFSVTSETPALIQVFADSPRDGGIIRLASVPVRLLPSGTNDIRAGNANLERIEIHSPAPGATISGGSVTVSGIALASFEQTLVADLLDADGNTLARRPITVDAPDLGVPGTYSVALPYTISASTPARIVVRDMSPAFGGTTHLSSTEITLNP